MSQYRAKLAYQSSAEADTYDDLRFRSFKGRMEDALEKRATMRALRDVASGTRVLDLPCGTGRITKWLLDAGYRVVGADISEAMMEHARKLLGDSANLERLQQADPESLPFSDEEFDAVTSIRSTNHVPPDIRRKVLAEMRRVCRGPIIISYCNPHTLSALKRRLKALIRKPHAPWNPASPQQVSTEASEAGLVVKSKHPILPLIPETIVYELVRSGEKA